MLSATSRQSIEKLINEKEANIMKALTDEISIDLDVITRKMLQKEGHDQTSDDLRAEKEKLEQHAHSIDRYELEAYSELDNRSDEVERQLNTEFEALRMRQREDESRLEQQHRAEAEQFKQHKKEVITQYKQQLVAILNDAVDAAYPGTTLRLQEIEALLPTIAKLERNIQAEVNRKAETIERMRSRLQHLVRDAAAAAKTQLLKCNSEEDAFLVIERLPTVAELLSYVDDPESGLQQLVERLAPSHPLAIAAPKFVVTQADEEGKPTKALVGDDEYEVVYLEQED